MRRHVVLLMSGVSAGVVIAAAQSSEVVGQHPNAAAPAGVVVDGAVQPSTAATRTTPASRSKPQRTAKAASTQPRPTVAPPAPAPKPTAAPALAAPKPSATKASVSTVTVNGAPVDTRYGPVQVQVKIRGGKIVFADAIDYPQSEDRDRQINGYAVPQLNQETLDAQSSQIDTVSGATFTSEGYRESLQSALDAAHFRG